MSVIYVQMLSLRSLEAHKDFFFKYYPFVLANAVHAAFTFLCPGSRHLYKEGFRRILYLQVRTKGLEGGVWGNVILAGGQMEPPGFVAPPVNVHLLVRSRSC